MQELTFDQKLDRNWSSFVLSLFALVMALIFMGVIAFSGIHKELGQFFSFESLAGLFNTLGLLVLTLAMSSLWAIPSAWGLSQYKVRGKGIYLFALMIPLAIPTYVSAFVVTELIGPGQLLDQALGAIGLRSLLKSQLTILFFSAFSLSLVLFPYIFLAAYTGFKDISANYRNVYKLFCQSKRNYFFSVGLPMALPRILGGALLVTVEVLGEYGGVSLFNLETYSVLFFDSWTNQFSLQAAAPYMIALLLLTLAIVFCFRWVERKLSRFERKGISSEDHAEIRTTSWKVQVWLMAMLALTVVLPALRLLTLAQGAELSFDNYFTEILSNSLFLAFSVSGTIVLLSLIMYHSMCFGRSKLRGYFIALASSGYLMPGIFLGFGLLVLASQVGLIAVSIPLLLFVALVMRFLLLGNRLLLKALSRTDRGLHSVLSSYKNRVSGWFFYIYGGMAAPVLLMGLSSIIFDSLKEMPLILLLRPAGFDTLSTVIFGYSEEGQWEVAAFFSLVLIGIGLIFQVVSYLIGKRLKVIPT